MKKKTIDKDSVTRDYLDWVLTKGKEPSSVYAFCKELGYEEQEFYKFFPSFRAIDRELWSQLFDGLLERLNKDETYQGYGAREKLLAFYYTLVEELAKNKSYVAFSWKKGHHKSLHPTFLNVIKDKFTGYLKEILSEGNSTGEVNERLFIGNYYPELLWYQFVYVVRTWIHDDSEGGQTTDEAIEKAVNLSFELMGPNLFDSLFDFGKFWWKVNK